MADTGGRSAKGPSSLVSGGGETAIRPILVALGDSRVLHVLSEPSLARLAAAGGSISLAKGETLCQAGDPGDAVYVILQGEVEILLRSHGGREVRVAAFGSGALVGEMAALDGGPRSADMMATRPCRLWRIPRAALLEVLEAEPKSAIALLVELSRRLRTINDALDASARLNLRARLARLLMRERGARGLVALTQTEMARRVDASRERVNRTLHAWADQGLVEIAPAGVRVLTEILGGLADIERGS